MAVHWFAWLSFALAVIVLCGIFIFLTAASYAEKDSEEQKDAAKWFFRCLVGIIVLLAIGVASAQHASDQNNGLGSRNARYFKAQGFKILSAYGHEVCVQAGLHKLCLQEREDATGTKQLVAQLASGKWFVIHDPGSGYMDALSHAPSD